MNNNKQLNKGDKMRKIAMIVGLISVLAASTSVFTTSANASSWECTPTWGGGYNCRVVPW